MLPLSLCGAAITATRAEPLIIAASRLPDIRRHFCHDTCRCRYRIIAATEGADAPISRRAYRCMPCR